jgi:hypothetical protein
MLKNIKTILKSRVTVIKKRFQVPEYIYENKIKVYNLYKKENLIIRIFFTKIMLYFVSIVFSIHHC